MGVNKRNWIPLPFIPSRQGRRYFNGIFKLLEGNSQTQRCKNLTPKLDGFKDQPGQPGAEPGHIDHEK